MKPTKLDELRTILLGPDHEKLDALQQRVAQPQRRTVDVAEVLPDSVAASFDKDSRLIDALRTPLRQCVSESVREDPDEYADALFPVMGPAIRRAVAEAFPSLAGLLDLRFETADASVLAEKVDLAFAALPHAASAGRVRAGWEGCASAATQRRELSPRRS